MAPLIHPCGIRLDLKGREWYEEHMEVFVKNKLGKIPSWDDAKKGNPFLKEPGFWPDNQISNLLLAWREIKSEAGDDPIVLPGRDTWEFEILARLEGVETCFRPEISSLTKHQTGVVGKFTKYFGTDSGISGSVPKALGCKKWKLVHFAGTNRTEHQLGYYAPGDKKNCSNHIQFIYSPLECTPKYWMRGELVNSLDNTSAIRQNFSAEQQFLQAAVHVRTICEAILNRKVTLPKGV